MELTELITKECFFKKKKRKLVQDYVYEVNGYRITVPKGFITDGASVPDILKPIYNPFGRYFPAAVIHDYLYGRINNTGINRTLADKIFNFIMKELKIDRSTRRKFYWAVRCFGELSWKKKITNEGYKDQAIIDRTDEAKAYYAYWKEKINL